MSNLTETPIWEEFIYLVEQTDPVLGGEPNLATKAGLANIQPQQLANRTAYLKQLIDGILGGAPDALNTLQEIAAALNDDANLAATLTALIATKMNAADGVGTGITSLEKLIVGAAIVAETHAKMQVNGFLRSGALFLYPHVGDDPLNALVPGQDSVLRKMLDGSLSYGAGETVFTYISTHVQKTAAGSVPLPGGLILKWGASANSGNTGYAQAVFPIAFPNACLFAMGVDRSSAAAGAAGVSRAGVLHDQMLAATVAFRITDHTGAIVNGDSVHYLAIGH
ncbi:gp53-like domain-containing protein [Aliiroseovarius lamellibrachiae]|uniref:gp53-like domain-containing protein n=1 Tax=Aliiroseovarius lamellibrachiae TaxID=1924933 RepID=UPI001BE07297|nr:hypothetical protein [Aliiroseovarius lamellibrachiae]MBT2131229.1 hypothetical protein [Aliiroseovarius lamellibrachiae]